MYSIILIYGCALLQELKREGLPFRPEADLAHAPTIMAPPVRSSRPTPAPHSGDDDAALAAAIAASMKDVAPVRSAKPTGQAEQPFLSSTGPAETDDISGRPMPVLCIVCFSPLFAFFYF